jgi:hypothetical protein
MFNAIPTEITISFISEAMETLILKCIWKYKRPWISKTTEKE